jgi:hypothetical protein
MSDSTTVGQRFLQLISHLGISKNAFAVSLDKTATVIQHIVDERNKPGYDLLCKVFDMYPNVSKDWLLLGAGPMLYASNENSSAEPEQSVKTPIEEPTPGTNASVAAQSIVSSPSVSEPPTIKPVIEQPASAAIPMAATGPSFTHEVAAPVASPAPDTSWQTALYTQQVAHQLAMAELRNQHLQEQQRLMQQMMDLMQRQLSR